MMLIRDTFVFARYAHSYQETPNMTKCKNNRKTDPTRFGDAILEAGKVTVTGNIEEHSAISRHSFDHAPS